MHARATRLVAVVVVAAGVAALGPAAGSGSTEVARVVVQLADPPLATYRDTLPELTGVLLARTEDGHLDVGAPASRAYLAYLATQQTAFEQALAATVPGAVVHWRYRIAFNGLTIVVPKSGLDAVRALPGVVAVTETYPLEPELDESRVLLDLPKLWSPLPNGVKSAGEGRRVALIDGGVNPAHPFFDPTGYSAPAGYPRAERVAGNVRTPLPTPTYASNKVIVGSVYAIPGNEAALPIGLASFHGTHVAGIMAGNDGTYTYTTGGSAFDLPFSGMAPRAWIMSYTLAGDSAEFIAAIEDVVRDKADALNISLGHSRWLTTNVKDDPVREALDAAVEAGTVVAASAGNAGTNGDSTITGSWKLSPKVITVASSSHARVFANSVTVTGPGAPPASLQDRVAVAGSAPAPPVATTISGVYVVAPGGTGGNAGEACSPLASGSMSGKIALVARGTCSFDIKKNNVRDAGAVAMIVHNNGADGPTVMGGFTAPAIPAVMTTRADGQAMVAWAAANTEPTVDIEAPVQRLRSGWPDVASSFSSRGPAPVKTLKPDIAAPGASVLSSIVDAAGNVTPPFFDQLSGTSMATPHVTGLAAVVKQLHPSWSPAQVKSAMLNTAETRMFLDIAQTTPALTTHRGAGRVQPSRLVDPQLTFDPPSVTFGFVPAGQTARVTITATDMRTDGSATAYAVTSRAVAGHPAVVVTPTSSFTTEPDTSATFSVDLATTGAPAGDYEGFVEIAGGGQTYTIPYFVRVQDPVKDVLLIDWDRNVPDLRDLYTVALGAAGVTFDVFDGGLSTAANGNPGPTFAQLQKYRTVILYTGNNTTSWSTAHTGGSFPLQDYLIAGGRLIVVGQDLQSQVAYNQNVGTDFNFTSMAGWLNGRTTTPILGGTACVTTADDIDFYGSPAAADRLETTFTLLGKRGDVSVNLGGNGSNSQRFPNAGRVITSADSSDPCTLLYNDDSIAAHARVLGEYVTTSINGEAVSRLTKAVATGVVPDPTLAAREPKVSWAAALLHVGVEGVNGNRGELTPTSALLSLYDFVADELSVAVTHRVRGDRAEFTARSTSSRGAATTRYRWDFGDGSPIVETTGPTVSHTYPARGTYTAYVEAVDTLTRTAVGTATVTIKRR